MRKYFAYIIFLFACLIVLLTFPWNSRPSTHIDGHTFYVEIAQTTQQQEIGLAKYTTIAPNFAMYFPFNHSDYYAFWMKGMHFPIDMLFLQNGKIVTIAHDVPVEVNYQDYIYRPTQPANAVLEITAGLSKKYGFHTGDTVIIRK